MRSHLLNDTTAERYRRTVTEGVERVAAHLAATDRPFTGITVDALAPRIDGIDLDRPLYDTAAVLDELEEVYLRDAVHFHHPRYLAHLNCPVVIPALLGEAVLTAVNSSLDTWDQSAGGTLIERKLIDWTAARIGLGPAADGVFTSGGTQSNLQALLLAREEAKTDDLASLRIFASEVSHFSVQKSAKLLGLGPDAVVTLPVDHDKRLHTVALARELERCRRDGLVPMAVVATAGTTDFGSIDPLPEIADLCARYGTWMHVDAAYGCGLLTSLKHRDRIDGIEHADSVTVDYHKSFFQPVSSSAVLVRDAATLRHATYHAEYLNPRRMVHERIPNQVDKSLQTTRRFDASSCGRPCASWAPTASDSSSTRCATSPPRAGNCSPRTRASTSSSRPRCPPWSSATSPPPSPTPPGSTAPTSTPARPCSPPGTPWSRAPRSAAATT